MALLFAYGIYLHGGGTPSGFMDLNTTDAQILISTEVGLRRMQATFIAEEIARMFQKEE